MDRPKYQVQHRHWVPSHYCTNSSRHPSKFRFVSNRPMVEANINLPNLAMGTTTITQLHRIILANEPRLLREMLERVFDSTPGLQVVAVVENPLQLASVVDQEEAHWLIVTLDSETGGLSSYFANDSAPPSLMAISTDGRQVEIQTTRPDGHQETYTLYDISLENLLTILR